MPALRSAVAATVCRTESKALRQLRGHGTLEQRQQWGKYDQEYIINASPLGTLLNSACLLPLSSMNDLHIEYYLGSAQSVLACDSPDKTLYGFVFLVRYRAAFNLLKLKIDSILFFEQSTGHFMYRLFVPIQSSVRADEHA